MKTYVYAVTAGCLLAVPVSAGASVITHNMLTNGESNVTLNLTKATVDVFAGGGAFSHKTHGGYTATGIFGGSSHGEIDGNQSITFVFNVPTIVTSLTIAFLYPANEFHGDLWDEIALFTTNLGSFTLEATGETTSIWTGFGTAVNVAPAAEDEAGVWNISGADIFGGAITSLVLSSGNPGPHGGYGDFSFHSMVIPGPGALAFLAGALAIGRTRRR